MMTFDYAASAELFMPKRKRGARQPLSYRRFATAAEAIRFAVEEFPAIRTLGAWMQVGEERFNGDDIQRLYESPLVTRGAVARGNQGEICSDIGFERSRACYDRDVKSLAAMPPPLHEAAPLEARPVSKLGRFAPAHIGARHRGLPERKESAASPTRA